MTVAIIGILAAISIPLFNDYKLKAKMTGVVSELKLLETAAIAYNLENESYPVDEQRGVVPAAITHLLPNNFFAQETPIGGVYDYEGPPNWTIAGFSIRDTEFNFGDPEWTLLDNIADNGNILTGKFREEQDWYVYVIDETP